MASRSLNKVQLIGNLTRDPELRYTPTGAAVCTIGLATNRTWTTEAGEKKEEVEFHRIIAWNKLAELCSQLLTKGRKIFIEGRLRTNSWTAQDGTQRNTTEIVMEDMILLDSKRPIPAGEGEGEGADTGAPQAPAASSQGTPTPPPAKGKKAKTDTAVKEPQQDAPSEEVNPDDIPF
jgi:single-strand DNA-binding protein